MTRSFKVPIRNLFCLLSYVNDTHDLIKSFNDVDEDIITYDFIAKRFLKEVEILHHRGFLKNYVSRIEETNRLGGRILMNESLNHLLSKRPAMVCEKDEYALNIQLNQVMKATLKRLCGNRFVKEETRIRSFKWLELFSDVENVKLSKEMFLRNNYNQHNFYYKRMMHIALLLYDLTLLSHKSGNWSLFTAELDESAFNQLFEKFLFHFYRIEQKEYRVSVEQMQWGLEGNRDFLPTMRTDISLTHKYEKQKIIMDAKFYKNVFQEYFGKSTFHSNNMYQLFTYLMHQNEELNVRGILIYPYNGTEVSEFYRWNKRITMEILTVSLDDSWGNIYKKLIEIICD